jgi:polyhydroxyalkanoate synthesis repressor PhaR
MARSGRKTGRPCDPAGQAPHKTVARSVETAYFQFLGPIPGVNGRCASKIMAKSDEPITIKKYANRRLYNTGTSTYVTLEDLATMVKAGENFVVYDAKTSEDITRSVLAQIIFEQENKEGQNLLPINFLRQLIRFYGDSMQMMVPRYLEVSLESFTKEQEKLRQQMAQAFGVGVGNSPFGSMEEQVRRNMEMFEKAFAMFTPFARRESKEGVAPADKPGAPASEDIDALKRQIEEMQRRIDKISDKE